MNYFIVKIKCKKMKSIVQHIRIKTGIASLGEKIGVYHELEKEVNLIKGRINVLALAHSNFTKLSNDNLVKIEGYNQIDKVHKEELVKAINGKYNNNFSVYIDEVKLEKSLITKLTKEQDKLFKGSETKTIYESIITIKKAFNQEKINEGDLQKAINAIIIKYPEAASITNEIMHGKDEREDIDPYIHASATEGINPDLLPIIEEYDKLKSAEKKDKPLLWFILGKGTASLKMPKDASSYVNESEIKEQTCGNPGSGCTYFYDHYGTGICSQIGMDAEENDDITPGGWCRLWKKYEVKDDSGDS